MKNDWKKFEKNNLTIALNVLYAKKEKIYIIVSKHNNDCEKHVIRLMIPNKEKQEAKSERCQAQSEGGRWNKKKLSALLKGD